MNTRGAPLYRPAASRQIPHERKTTLHVANIKSQIKRIKTNQKAQERNRAVKSELKTAVRAAREAIAAGDKTKATAAVRFANRKLDKAASKGVIHKNQAANRKSAIAKHAEAL
jgi:small subunit ribosomal protein S20